ncbi:MAG: hypothetical protein E7011_01930 [Alphaproteobacteria bacterium]|nr:hypothetical protein [Alphaproteobacteria bacterium]
MKKSQNILSASLISALCGLLCICDTNAATVVSRTQRKSVAASRMPTMAARIQATTAAQSDTSQPDPAPQSESTDISDTDETETETETIITDKSSQFDELLNTNTPGTDTSGSALADAIRAQRAALDALDASTAAATQTKKSLSSGQNACDANLRACMMEKCGSDFTKCAGDTDTLFGTKLDACRRDLPCTGEEYSLFTTEIRADRDFNAKISLYNKTIDCGNRYNECIITQCGTYLEKCLGKSAGDLAITKCEKIAKSCTEMDSGLASRTMNVFGTLRVEAEKQVARDEERLYELRDMMRDTCNRIGAMFDERTLDCVYTVNFYAGDDNTLYASKKAYAGSTFNCDQNWFGVDITTFKENAMRLTREQKSATSALMGSGIGMGVGALTSGAIDRAIDRHRADTALKDAQDEHNELYGEDTGTSNSKSDKSETKKEKGKENTADKKNNTKAKESADGEPAKEEKPSNSEQAEKSNETGKEQQETPQKDGKNVQENNDKQSSASGDKPNTPSNNSANSSPSTGDSTTGGSDADSK